MSLELTAVNYVYAPKTAYEIHALKNINLKINAGEFIGVIGQTGSGKSTLMQLLNGLEKPTAGRICFHGEDIWGEKYDRRRLRSRVGLVFQYPEYQLFETDVLTDVCFGPKNLGFSAEEATARAKRALQLVGMGEDCYQSSPFSLSGGQKRRVAIAGVLAMEPEILILDEPTAGLDPHGRDEIFAQVKRLHEEAHITILLVSHSMEDVAQYVERLLVLSDGALLFDDTPKAVFSHGDALRKIGLDVPGVTDILCRLADRGFFVDTSCVTTDEACETILRAMGRRSAC